MKYPWLLLLGLLLSPPASLSAATLKDALDAPALTWSSGGSASWVAQSSATHDGVDAAASGLIADNQESWIETMVAGPGTLTFWWNVSSEADFDWFRFQIDGVFKDQISGSSGWLEDSFPVGEGTHAFRWRYIKDVNGSGLEDRGWLDEVAFTPVPGAPSIAVPPLSQTVWEGANVTFETVVLGSPPFSYQWLFNGSIPIAGATNFSWTVTNALPRDVGSYSLRVSNASGSVVSQAARLDLSAGGSVAKAILFVDGSFGSAYEVALHRLGIAFEKYLDEFTFSQALAASEPTTTLVLLDALDGSHDFSAVVSHIAAGGRAAGQTSEVIGSPALAAAFGVVVDKRITAPSSVSDWGGSPLFAGLQSPLTFTDYGYAEDGQRFSALPGARAVAGSGAAPSAGQAAMVIGNEGRTIINGLWPEELTRTGDALRLAENQIRFLVGPVSASAPVLISQPQETVAVVGAQATLQLTAWGASPMSVRWFQNGSVLAGATGQVLRITNIDLSHAGSYRAVLSNSWGTTVSREAVPKVSTNGPVGRVLLFTDFAGGSLYPLALANFLADKPVLLDSYTDAGEFNAALSSASAMDTLAIADCPQTVFGFDSLSDFVRRGGRAILHNWNLSQASELTAAFGARVLETLFNVPTLRKWVAHPIFDGLTLPIDFQDINNVSGQRFQPLAGSVALAGYVASTTSSQAGIVLGNRGRTLLNGFFVSEMADEANGGQFISNELGFFIPPGGPVILSQPLGQVVAVGSDLELHVLASGDFDLQYQWFFEDAPVPGANQADLKLKHVGPDQGGRYQVKISGASGVAISDVAWLVLVDPPSAPVAGLSYGQWSAKWWEWALSLSASHHPLFGSAGWEAGQSGETWFLGGAFAAPGETSSGGLSPIHRRCVIPHGHSLLVPLVTQECSVLEGDGPAEASLRSCAARELPAASTVACWVDGVPVEDIEAYRTVSPLFEFGPLPQDNLLSRQGVVAPGGAVSSAVADGYQVILAPLPSGSHTIRVAGFSQSAGVLVPQEAVYDLVVLPAGAALISGITADSRGVDLTFWSSALVRYQVESATAVGGPWATESGVIQGDGVQKDVRLPSTDPRRFYRVKSVP